MSGIRVASGHLFFFYAYDVGFEIGLEEARALCEASDSPGIAGLRPAPAYLQYRPMPLTVPAGTVPVQVSGKTYRLDATVKMAVAARNAGVGWLVDLVMLVSTPGAPTPRLREN